jgi:two-component system chemotaxis response regulator CheB
VIRVLVAEDSEAARALLVKALAIDPEIRVVGQARDGVEAVELTQKLRPDLVTMDIQMPRMGGLEATEEIMITAPTPIVIVTASTRIHEVGASLEALRVGALDVLVKPSLASPDYPGEVRRLVSSVKEISRVRVARPRPPAPSASPAAPPAPETPPEARALAVAVAASAGGPMALQRLLAGLPADFAVPILVAQRITQGLTPGLVAWLDSGCPLRVKVADEGEPLAPRYVYLAPDGRHLGVSKRGTVALSVAPPLKGCRPSGSYLFDSAARVYGQALVAVVLSGEGDDGVAGLPAVREAGGRVLAQDEATSVVFGMPRAAAAAGLVDDVLPLEAIADRLVALV